MDWCGVHGRWSSPAHDPTTPAWSPAGS
jgi:hypothetical protein